MTSNAPTSRPSVPVLGLTGAVGAGKSTAARLFAERGCTVLDVDRMGHEALDVPGVAREVAREFGAAVLGADGRVDRQTLAGKAFGDPAALARLEAIVHPEVRRRLDRDLAAARAASPRAIVIDCALLFEGGLASLCDATIVVESADETRTRRVAASRGWTPAELARREASQLSAAEKRARADRVLGNDGSPGDLGRRIGELLDELVPQVSNGGTARARPAAGRQER